MIIHRGIEQGTDEWKRLRLGKLTASRFKDVMSKGRGNAPSKTREAYMMQLASEILTGEPQDSYTNKAMEWGNETEPRACAKYELKNDVDVEHVAFIEPYEGAPYGVSPDGMVGSNGLLEIKCPNTTTQIQRVLKGEFPKEYLAQVQGQMWVAEREWCDFVSFDPRIATDADYFEIRVYRDDKYIKDLEAACLAFIDEMNELLTKLNWRK